MKKNTIPVEFVYQLFALIISIIIVHGYYVSVIRPNANQIIIEQKIEAEVNPNYVKKRSAWILVKDFEQESCFILMIWALAIMGFKIAAILNERKLLEANLISIADGMKILPDDVRDLERQIELLDEKKQRMVLPRALLNALRRFGATKNIQDVCDRPHLAWRPQGRASLRGGSKKLQELPGLRVIAVSTSDTLFHRNIGGFIVQGGDDTFGKYFQCTYSILLPKMLHVLSWFASRLVVSTSYA